MQQKTEDGLKKLLKISPGCTEPQNMGCSTQERSFNGRVQVLGVGYAPLLAPGGASTRVLYFFSETLEGELVKQSVPVMTDCYVKCCPRLATTSSLQHWQLAFELRNKFS